MLSAHFGRERRLTESSQFTQVFAGARRSSDRYFTVLSRISDQEFARLGLTVSRRAARNAVDRNRIKRHVRECFRHLELGPRDFVVMARAPAARAEAEALRESLERHFTRLARAPAPGQRDA